MVLSLLSFMRMPLLPLVASDQNHLWCVNRVSGFFAGMMLRGKKARWCHPLVDSPWVLSGASVTALRSRARAAEHRNGTPCRAKYGVAAPFLGRLRP